MSETPHEPKRSSATMPSDISPRVGRFDRFSSQASKFTGRPGFFLFCAVVVLIWAPTIIWFEKLTWHLIIDTITTIITFLMVALLQNSETRNEAALQHKLNAVAGALADILDRMPDADHEDAQERRHELHRAVGLEDDESV